MQWWRAEPHTVRASACLSGLSYHQCFFVFFNKALEEFKKKRKLRWALLISDVLLWCFLAAFSLSEPWRFMGGSVLEERSAITTSVCPRYRLFVVLPTTHSFLIAFEIYSLRNETTVVETCCMSCLLFDCKQLNCWYGFKCCFLSTIYLLCPT